MPVNTLTPNNLNAGTASLGVPSFNPPVVVSDYTLDNGMVLFHNTCDRIYVCTGPITDFNSVISTALGNKVFGAGNAFGGIVSGSPSGRVVTSIAFTDGNITANGLAICWAAVDFANSHLLAWGVLAGDVTVQIGQLFGLPAFAIHEPAWFAGANITVICQPAISIASQAAAIGIPKISNVLASSSLAAAAAALGTPSLQPRNSLTAFNFVPIRTNFFGVPTIVASGVRNLTATSLASAAAGIGVPVLNAGTFAWQNVQIGGGGYCRGMDMHPDGTMVIKVDVYGGYVGNTVVGNVWKQLVTTGMPSNYSQSGTTNRYPIAAGAGATCIRIAPSNSNIMYMIYDGYGAALLVSQDKGNTWTDCAFTGTLPSQANGQYADYAAGQIAIDPGNPNIVYVGTPTGLFKSVNGLSGNSATWAAVNAGVFGTTTNPGIVAMCIDPTSGVTGGSTNRVIVGVFGKGVYYSANGGGTWTLAAGSTTGPGHGALGVDGTYYVTDTVGTGIGRLTTGNVYSNIGPPSFTHSIACDPVNPARLIAQMASGSLNLPLGPVNSGTPSWSGDWQNKGLHAPVGQPKWIENSNDSYLTPGDTYFDPFQTTSSTSATIGNGAFTFAVPAGLNLAVGNGVRVYETANKANFIEGFVTAYAGTSLTLTSMNVIASNSVACGTGTKTFTVPAGFAYAIGSSCMMVSNSNQNLNMTGTVTAYAGTTLTVNVTNANGSGSVSDWRVNQGSQGGSGTFADWTIMKNRVWFAYGCGVLYSDYPIAPGQQVWQVQTTGIENLVTNQIQWPPGGPPIAVFWDRPLWILSSPAVAPANYYPYNAPGQNNVIYGASIDYAKATPTFFVGLEALHGVAFYNGSVWAPATGQPGGTTGAGGSGNGNIAATDTLRWVVARSNNNAIYQTQNGGGAWAAVTGAPISGWGSNGNIGPRRILCADEVTAGVFYAYNSGTSPGLWVSTDGGQSMIHGFSGTLGPNDGYEFQMRAVPGNSGHIFACDGVTPGLSGHPDLNNLFYRSTNALAGAGNVTFSSVPNVAEVQCFGFGKAQAGGYPAIYIVGWVNQGAGYTFGVWRSDDNAGSWNNMATWVPRTDISGPNGWLDEPVTMAGNPNRWNSCVIGYPGSSVAYYGPQGSY